jgi:hypothetical protein
VLTVRSRKQVPWITFSSPLSYYTSLVNQPGPPDNWRTDINLSKVPLEEAAYCALSKGLNYTVAPRFIPINDILCGVEKAIRILPEDSAEEIRSLKDSRKPKSDLNCAERRALRSFKANGLLTTLPADKGNVAMVLGTSDYNWKTTTLVEDKVYMRLKKGSNGFYRAKHCSSLEEVPAC